jgi:DNA polymerase-1
MMLDYAGQADLIEEIKQGKDVHQATADLVGVTRSAAKTLNYALLYGVGNEKLSGMLGISFNEARDIKNRYFSALPGIKDFVRTAMEVARERKFVRSWAGRVFLFPEEDFFYKAPNKVIQGGCADVLKIAMVKLEAFLKPYKSHMKLQIHDELLFGVHKSETHIVPEIVRIMENVYIPMNHMPLTCSVSWSSTSWGTPDKIKGYPPKTLDLGASTEYNQTYGSPKK